MNCLFCKKPMANHDFHNQCIICNINFSKMNNNYYGICSNEGFQAHIINKFGQIAPYCRVNIHPDQIVIYYDIEKKFIYNISNPTIDIVVNLVKKILKMNKFL